MPRQVRQHVIQVRDLRKVYHDGTEAVKGISFHVRNGEIFGLLGPNGAGKTTTMRILGTLHGATSGDVRVLGLDPHKDAQKLRRRIGFAMQEVGMDDLATAREMLVFHGRLAGLDKATSKRRTEELLRTFELEDHADRRVTRFSGGMQRRLDLAVSIIHRPELLFLDEPSTGLDPKSRTDLWRILRDLRDKHGLTIVMSTHYMDEADALCDRIAVVAGGRIEAIDTPENLKRRVGDDSVTVEVGEEPTEEALVSIASHFGKHKVLHRGSEVRISVPDGPRQLTAVLEVVQAAGLQVQATRVRSPTLDDVFLKFTGHSLHPHTEGEL